MTRVLRDIGIVAWNEVTDAVRSRRAILWILLYLVSALAATFAFTIILHQIETEVARLAQIGQVNKAGVMTQSLWESNSFRHIVIGLVGDKELAESVIRKPPLALFFGWVSLAFAPFLIVLLASECISSEVASGTARFVLIRTDRFSWVTGKLLGQSVILFFAILSSGLGAYCVGMFRMAHFSYVSTGVSVLGASLKAWVYCLSFLGMSVGVSQLSRKVPLTRILAVLAYLGSGILALVANNQAGPGLRRLWELLYILLPQGHKSNLWIDDLPHLGSSIIFFLALGFLYYVVGYFVFSRRDV